ncbi:DUF5343 domain-containing protein [Amycolatopsis sp. FBCC-B4732]|nr:DUF5343 domain-containing protein [Amycolatopsis sp. FBCC-B4732]
MQKAQAPERFTQKFLEDLGFPSSADRLVITMLKALGLLTDTGQPTQRYHEFLDRSEAKKVLAQAIRSAYADLFQLNKNAHQMQKADVQGKMKTISQGQHSDEVLGKMAATFRAFSALADFSDEVDVSRQLEEGKKLSPANSDARPVDDVSGSGPLRMSGLVYNINIHLPESRDPAVYDALFRSLREHLR